MQTESKRENGKKTNDANGLPRGVRIHCGQPDRRKRWQLIVAGKLRESFETEKEAIEAAETLVEKQVEHGREVNDINVAEWRRYCEAKRLYFNGQEPDWPALGKVGARKAERLVSVAVADYLALRGAAGLAVGSVRQMQTKLEAFASVYGKRTLDQVTTTDLREWVAGLQAGGFAPWTVKDYLKIVSTFWHYARRERWTAEDPTDAVELPRIMPEEIGILTVDQARALVEKNLGKPGFGRLALEVFAGLRTSSAGRLVYADLKKEDQGIELPAARRLDDGAQRKNHKSGRRHYVDGLPDCLWAWLALVPKEDFEADARQYERQKTAAFIRAGIDNPPANCLRHSFATYHVAWKKDAALTAVLMQHAGAATLFRHYKGRATASDGVEYFEILPSTQK